jgi:transposase
MSGTEYASDVSDEQWKILRRRLPAVSLRGRPPLDRRWVLNAIFVCVVDGLPVAGVATRFPQVAECLHGVSSLAVGWDVGADSRRTPHTSTTGCGKEADADGCRGAAVRFRAQRLRASTERSNAVMLPLQPLARVVTGIGSCVAARINSAGIPGTRRNAAGSNWVCRMVAMRFGIVTGSVAGSPPLRLD